VAVKVGAYDRRMRVRGKRRREFHVEPVSAPWIELEQHRAVGVHRHVRVTLVGREVGAWNGYTEVFTSADLSRLADALERAADGDAVDVELGTLAEQLRLIHTGQGSLVLELRGELRPWYREETKEVARFELEAEADELRQAARNLRSEVQEWL
jgi:hypothetical protein